MTDGTTPTASEDKPTQSSYKEQHGESLELHSNNDATTTGMEDRTTTTIITPTISVAIDHDNNSERLRLVSQTDDTTDSTKSNTKLAESLTQDFLAITGNNNNNSADTTATSTDTTTTAAALDDSSTNTTTTINNNSRRRIFLQKTGELARRLWNRINPNLELCLCQTAVQQIQSEERLKQLDWIGSPAAADPELYRQMLFNEEITLRKICEE